MGRETTRVSGSNKFSPRKIYFKLTVFVSGLNVSDRVLRAVTPLTVGNDDPLSAIPVGKYCLLRMFTCIGVLANAVTITSLL